MKSETRVTSKGTTTIPEGLRRRAGIASGTILTWDFHEGGVLARPKRGAPTTMQKHIRAYAGAWTGKISGVELLRRTRG